MKKTLLALTLLLPLAVACGKSNTAETEMKLPTPVVSPTPIVINIAALTGSPTATETPTLEYTIEDLKGTGLILTGDDTVPESAVEGEAVEPGDELFTKDNSEMTLSLNDNTMIHMAANSHIKVTDLTSNTTNGFSSHIELLLGSILSEVEKLNESQSSFEIASGGVVCGVRGTGFEVQKQGDYVGTKTYHGTVEMKKDGVTQLVKENEHSTFNLKNSSFMPLRHLSQAEKKHYQTWIKTKNRVQKKRAARIAGGNPPQHRPAKVLGKKAENKKGHQPGAKLKQQQALHAAMKHNKASHPRPMNKPMVRRPMRPANTRPQPKNQNRPRLHPRQKKKKIN
jgi:hypothetical protein